MSRTLSLTLAFTLLASPLPLLATGSNLEAEYQQVRKIALRDPKVAAVYEEADQRLNAKIVQIDPALSGYTASRSHEPAAVPKAAPAEPAPKAAAAKPAIAYPDARTHKVAKGETLGSIATHYGVTVAALKTANHIQDERKLPVGQVLTIPGGKKTPPPPSKDQTWWNKLTS